MGKGLLLAVGVIATMVALGMYSAKPVGANDGVTSVGVTVTPTKARAIAQYTVVVDQTHTIFVGDTITVTFNTSTGVPSSIHYSWVKLKASAVTGGIADQLVDAGAITVSGKTVTITVPDMDPSSEGDQDIASGTVTITFTQAAGIRNPNLAKATTHATLYTLTVATTADTTAVTSSAYAITSFVNFTPSSAASGATVTVTGGGFEKNCTTCNIRISPQNVVAQTSAPVGTGSIDANGVFAGAITLTSSTCAGGFVWVTDSIGSSQVSSTVFVQIPICIGIGIDIMPGSGTNSIKPWNKGSVAVEILSTSTFNATTEIDESSLLFGSTGN